MPRDVGDLGLVAPPPSDAAGLPAVGEVAIVGDVGIKFGMDWFVLELSEEGNVEPKGICTVNVFGLEVFCSGGRREKLEKVTKMDTFLRVEISYLTFLSQWE